MQKSLFLYLAAMYRRLWLIILVVVLATGAVVAKELLVPPSYTAEKILVVTDAKAANTSAAGSLVPDPLSPKVYESLVISPTVVGQALDKLEASGFYDDRELPTILEFKSDLAVTVQEVDKTTRPVNYAPVLVLEANGDTEDGARQKVEVWAGVAMDTALRAAMMSSEAVGQVLETQKEDYESLLDTIYGKQQRELAKYDPEVLRREREIVQDLLVEQINAKEDALTELRLHQDRLKLIREELANTLDTLQEQYKQKVMELRTQLTAERAEWNLPLLQDQINLRNKMVNEKLAQLDDVKEKRAGLEQRLAAAREALETEQPTLQLFHAPSEVAFWMRAEKDGIQEALDSLKDKGMLSEQLNSVYWFLRNEELNAVTELASMQAREAVLQEQMDTRKQELEDLQKVYAEHTYTQDQLQTDESISLELYDATASAKRLELQGLEQSAVMNVTEAQARVGSAEDRIIELRATHDAMQTELAEHKYIQVRLANEEEAAVSIFKDIERLDDLVAAAKTLTRGGETIQTVGLNSLSDYTYVVENKGPLGKKGRVLVVAFMSFGLAVLLALLLEFGPAFLADVRKTGRARKKG